MYVVIILYLSDPRQVCFGGYEHTWNQIRYTRVNGILQVCGALELYRERERESWQEQTSMAEATEKEPGCEES